MTTMTAPKKKQQTGRGPGRPPKYGQTDESGRSGKRLSLDIDPVVWATISRYADAYHAKQKVRLGITQVVEKALIELFEREALWPPKKGT